MAPLAGPVAGGSRRGQGRRRDAVDDRRPGFHRFERKAGCGLGKGIAPRPDTTRVDVDEALSGVGPDSREASLARGRDDGM